MAELNFLEFKRFALGANNSLGAAFTLADRLFEILALLYGDDQTGLLHTAIKPTNQVLGGFFAVFAGYFYHVGSDYSLTGAATQAIKYGFVRDTVAATINLNRRRSMLG